MARRWLPLNALRAFEAVGKHLSVTAAANSLCVSQSAVSRHLLSLEQILGTKLFERKHQRLELTEAGKTLLPNVNKSFDRLEQAFNEIMKDGTAARRALRLQMPPSFAHHLAIPILRDFRNAFPEVLLDVTTVYAVGMPTTDVDVAIVYSKPEANDLIADLLWNVRLTPLCHPNLLQNFTTGDLAEFIAKNELIHVKFEDQSRYRLWERFMRQAELNGTTVDRGSVFDTAILAAKYAVSGEGVALLDPKLFEEELASGVLVQPFNTWLDDGYGYYLLTHSDDLVDEAIALFRSWIIRRFSISAK
ncbi:MAG: LysR family transcriptional regulator [Gammaproteobacteria bacterium]|nr:LysR family transcriptional regulator [Gammaproteobacteria bacterium]